MRYLIIFQFVQFFPRQEYHLFRSGFQFGFECIVCNVLMVSFLETPAQKPFEESHLFADGAVSHVFLVTQEIDIFVQSELIEVFKGYIFFELFEVIFHCCKFFVCGCRPIILIATLLYKLIEHFPKADRGFFRLFFTCIFHP